MTNLIRSLIFLVPGLALVFLPEEVRRFQNSVLDRLHPKLHIKKERVRESYRYSGMVFIVISIMLFVFSVTR